jgi:hypothetical protein
MSYFVEDLLSSIKFRSAAPISQNTFDDTAILGIAYEELELKLSSDLIKVREDFFLTSETKTISDSVAKYSIPSRSIGNALKALFFQDAVGAQIVPRKIDVSEAYKYANQKGVPEAFAMQGDEITVYPTPSASTGSIYFSFAAKPSKLTLTSNCAKINSISSSVSTASFVVNTDLTTSLSVGSYVDIISVNSPFKILAYRCAITQITSNQIDVALSGVIDESATIKPSVGDYICPTDTSNIPQIPTAFHPVLAQMTAVRLLESLGDTNKTQAAKQTLAELREEALILVRNRVETKPDKIRPRRNLLTYL